MHLILTLAHSRWLWFVLLLCASTYSLHARTWHRQALRRRKSQTLCMRCWTPTGPSTPTRWSIACRPRGSYLPWNIGNMKMRCRSPRSSCNIPANSSRSPDEAFATDSLAFGRFISVMPCHRAGAESPRKLFTDPRPAVHRDRDERPQTVLSSHLFRPSGFSGLRQVSQ